MAVTSDLPQTWSVRRFIDGDLARSWSVTTIDRIAEWNRKILLGEIDEDLMLIDQ